MVAACRGNFIDIELADRRATDKWALNGCWPDAIARPLAAGHDRLDRADREPTRALFVAAIANFNTARTLALNDDLAVLQAQFDLSNVTASGTDLFRDQGRARGEPAHIE